MSLIIPYPSASSFLGHDTNVNKTQFINEFINDNEDFTIFRNPEHRGNEYRSENEIKSSYMIYVINSLLMYNETFKENHFLKLTKEQIDSMIDAMLNISDDGYLFNGFLSYLEIFNMHQLIFIKTHINFAKIADYVICNRIKDFHIEDDKLFNISNITDINSSEFHRLYYEELEFHGYDLDDERPISERPRKNKTDYINDFYLKKNVYTDKKMIIAYFKLAFNKCYKSNFSGETLRTMYPKIKINESQMFIILQIISRNIKWVDKMKWVLYYLNIDQIEMIGI